MDSTMIGQRRTSVWAVLMALVAVVVAGFVLSIGPVVGAILLFAVIVGIVVFVHPIVGLVACILSLVAGQLVRIPIGSEGVLLPNDILLPGLAAGWLWNGMLAKRVRFPASPLSWPIATMLAVFVLTFIGGLSQFPFLTGREQLVSALYIVRWAEYALLLFIIADVVRTEATGKRLLWTLFGAAGIVTVLGFIQLKLFPNFSSMVPQGWDPHIGRMLSTWFDPNFLGGFLSFIAVIAGALALLAKGRSSVALWAFAAFLSVGVVLTFSRSGYAAFIAGVFVLTFLRSKRLFLLFVVVAGLVVTTVPRVHDRVVGAFNVDETAKTRIVSWKNALTVYADHPVFGIGYNTYRYVQVDYGFQKDAADHSAGGSDSSLLTILVTTGPVGLLAFCWMLWAYASIAWKSFKKGTTPLIRGLGLGALAAMASVVAHSFFINSLLFPHMMETIAVTFGILIGLRALEART